MEVHIVDFKGRLLVERHVDPETYSGDICARIEEHLVAAGETLIDIEIETTTLPLGDHGSHDSGSRTDSQAHQ
jgi:hypothetical protein